MHTVNVVCFYALLRDVWCNAMCRYVLAHCCALQLLQRALYVCWQPTGGKKGICWEPMEEGGGGSVVDRKGIVKIAKLCI